MNRNDFAKKIIGAGYVISAPTVYTWVKEPERMKMDEIKVVAEILGMKPILLCCNLFWGEDALSADQKESC